MAADGAFVKLEGLDELLVKLRSIPDALRKKTLRNAMAAGGRLVRDAAKKAAPTLQTPVPYRTKGLVRDAISVRTSKIAKRNGDVGVFVNVRPAKGAKFKTTTRRVLGVKVKTSTLKRQSDKGARSAKDPFYWRFLEFGWTPASGPRTSRERRLRRQNLKQGAPRKIPGKRFLRDSAKQFPAALRVIEANLAKWFAKTNATGKVQP